MTYQSFVQRQKELIRSRHVGETFLIDGGEVIKVSDSDRIFFELAGMRGLKKNQKTVRGKIAADGYECKI